MAFLIRNHSTGRGIAALHAHFMCVKTPYCMQFTDAKGVQKKTNANFLKVQVDFLAEIGDKLIKCMCQ